MKNQRGRELLRFWARNPVRMVLLVVELVCIAAAIWTAVQPPICYAFEAEQLENTAQGVTLGYDENGYYGATYDIEWQEILATPELTLSPGRYEATVEYYIRPTMMKDGLYHRSGIGLIDSKNESTVEDGILILDETSNTDTVTLTVWKQSETAVVRFVNDGGIFTVGKISIVQNMTYTVFEAIATILLCLALDLAILMLCPSSPLYVGAKTAVVVIVLGCATALASALALIDGVCLFDDCRFHLIRIEGIVQALRNGQFPVRINPIAKNGYGYATSLFYGELFLYFPAILRLCGVTIQGAYQTFVVAVHVLTAVISYRSFRPIFGRKIGLVGAVLYVLSPYRLHRLYAAAAIGEYLAITFLPAVVYGLWLLYNKDSDRKSRARASIVLALAFSALLQSHMINTEIAVLATAAVCLIYWRQTFRKTVLLAWIRAVGLAVLLNLWFLLPFVTVMTSGIYNEINEPNIQQRGQTLMALFNNSNKFAIGPSVLLCGAAAALILCAVRELPHRWKKLGAISLGFGTAGVVLSTKLFPWDAVEKLPFGKIFTVIQFPWRYTTLATIGLILTFLFVIKGIQQTEYGSWAKPLLSGTAAVAVICVLMYWSDWGQSMSPLTITDTPQLAYNNENFAYKMDGMYLPKNSCQTDDGFATPNIFTTVTTGDFSREDKGVTSVEYTEYLGQEGYVEFPLLYYPGYSVIEGEGTVVQSSNGLVGVVVPANSSGQLAVAFREPKRWLLADAVSAVTALVLTGCRICGKRRKCKCPAEDRQKKPV